MTGAGSGTGAGKIKIRYRRTFWEVKIRFLGALQKEGNVGSPQLSEPIDVLLPVLREEAGAEEQEKDLQAVC